MDKSQQDYERACGQLEGELWNLVARLEEKLGMSGIQAVFIVTKIIESIVLELTPEFTPDDLQDFIGITQKSESGS